MKDLSEANQKSVLKLWEGLGYYRRARNLHSTSKVLVKKYKNKLPQKIEEIMKLPGVGTYTANALLGLIRDEPRIAIDGNVKRIISRLLNEKDNNIDFNKFVLINKNNLFFLEEIAIFRSYHGIWRNHLQTKRSFVFPM